MTPSPDETNDNGYADEIFETVEYKAAVPEKREFKPWHKPRKQYVREFQWCKEIESLLEGFTPEGNTLKYLGLPGTDLLDLRYFHSRICEPRDMQLRFLGFNSEVDPRNPAHTSLNISLDEVRKLKGIDPLSEIIWDEFHLVGNTSEKAWHRAKELGPYEIINLDLCGGFAKHKPGAIDENYYNAINQLMSLQSRKKDPWLLLLTTRTEKGVIHEQLIQRLIDKFINNLETCPAFKLAATKKLEIEDEASLRSVSDTPEGHLSIFLTGLSKWLIGLATKQNPASRVAVKSVVGYRVYGASPHNDLMSIAFRFEPTFVPVGDPMGIANHPEEPLDECEQATEALEQVEQRICADTILAQDAALHGHLVEEMVDLLRQARYDVDAYREWIQAV